MTTLKRLRLRRGLSQGDLGAMLGTDYNSVLRWESLKHAPRPAYRQGLEHVFGLTMEELLAPVSDQERASAPRRSDAVN
jgi:transcriptional regulator with XRE-family HTH domain